MNTSMLSKLRKQSNAMIMQHGHALTRTAQLMLTAENTSSDKKYNRGEINMIERLDEAFTDLGSTGKSLAK